MADHDRVTAGDWAALLRIAAEVAELPASVTVRRQHLLTSFCTLLGAATATIFDATATAETDCATGLAKAGSLTMVHASAVQQGHLYRLITAPKAKVEPVERNMTSDVKARGAALREQFADDREWYGSTYYNETIRPVGLDDKLSCRIALPGDQWAGLSMWREPGDQRFDERDRQLLAMFHASASHLYSVPRPPLQRHLAGLPPRLRPILQGLLDGDGEKQIAAKLTLSPHTVHQYVKTLYKQLGVSTRSELFAKVRPG